MTENRTPTILHSQIRMLPNLILVPLDEDLANSAAQLAADLKLRGADAVYIALAAQLSL
ncbi:MAG: hypothetical protein AVDCRST_MAG93-5498, partial [uncultured Chloroflexia bacterium]